MTRREITQEVAARCGRNPEAGRMNAFVLRQSAIETAFRSQLDAAERSANVMDPEFCRHYPVALVAAIEGYFRQCVADLVNSGSPFLDRMSKLKEIPLTLIAVNAIKEDRITLGDYVAHSISISSLDDVNRTMSTLLGLDFLETLLNSEFAVFDKGETLRFHESSADVVAAARELFQTRHVLCHEFANQITLDPGELVRMFTVTDMLVALSEVIVWEKEAKPEG